MQTHAANLRIQFFEALRRSYKSPAGAEPRYEMRYAAGSLRPDFVRGGAVVRLPVCRIAVLIGIKVFFGLRGHDFMDFVNRAVSAFIARSDHQFRAIGRQNALALVGSAVRQAKLDGIACCRTDHGVSDSGVAAGRVNDGPAGLQSTAGEPCPDHAECRAVLHRPAGIEPLRLGVKRNVREVPRDVLQPEQGGVPNTIQQGFSHAARLSR